MRHIKGMRTRLLEFAALAGIALAAEPTQAQVAVGSTVAPPPKVAPIRQPQAHPIPVPDVPQPQPGIYSSNPPPGLPTYDPTPTVPLGQYSPPLAPSPVTNYGPGGIAPIPGAPANPPYSAGGIGGPLDQHP